MSRIQADNKVPNTGLAPKTGPILLRLGLFIAAKMSKKSITPLFIVKCRLQGTFYSRKVVKSVFEPTFYCDLLQVKSGKCANSLFTTFFEQ